MTTTLTERTTLHGGILAVQLLASTRLNFTLTDEQSETLWTECSTRLRRKDIAEIKESQTGRLDTYTREFLMDTMGHVLAGMEWPCNMDGREYADKFRTAMQKSCLERGYVFASDEA